MRLIIGFRFWVVMLRLLAEGVVGRRARGFERVGDGVVAIGTRGFGILIERVASKRPKKRTLGRCWEREKRVQRMLRIIPYREDRPRL